MQQGVSFPYSNIFVFQSNSFALNVLIDANNNLTITNVLNGQIVIPSTSFHEGSQCVFAINGSNYTLYALPEGYPIETSEGPQGYPTGKWDQARWGRFSWG